MCQIIHVVDLPIEIRDRVLDLTHVFDDGFDEFLFDVPEFSIEPIQFGSKSSEPLRLRNLLTRDVIVGKKPYVTPAHAA